MAAIRPLRITRNEVDSSAWLAYYLCVMAAISLTNVTKIYRRSHLGRTYSTTGVQNISFEVRTGEVFGLLGLNGSGKTTTIKMLLGLLRPTHGTIHMLDRALPNLDVLARVGYLPEAAYLNKLLTGREVLRLFASLSGLPVNEREKAVISILERVGMTRVADRKIGEYSKGMLQRIGMAQALVHDPDLLIFDEPITGLDPLAVKDMRALVLWLKSRGKTVFFSSHDIPEVEKLCDRIGILAGGTLALIADKKEWEAKPGKLEELFTSTVKRSDAIGTLNFS